MKLDDNQLFYATLYWAEALPGGRAFSHDICKEYGKAYKPMNPPQQTSDTVKCEFSPFEDDMDEFLLKEERVKYKAESGVSREEFVMFFDAMYGFLRQDREKECQAFDGKGGIYLDLSRRGGGSSKVYHSFSAAIEQGLEAAGLDREILNPRAEAYVHDNGQIFAMPGDGSGFRDVADVDYPGRPGTGYRSLPDFWLEYASRATSTVQIEHFYRQIELKTGQRYMSVGMAGGERWTYEEVAKEGEFFSLGNYNVGGDLGVLSSLSDDEILNGQDLRMTGGCAFPQKDRKKYQPGYTNEGNGLSSEATDHPQIVRQVQRPMRCMDVTEKMQLRYGRDFQLAEPGDKIVFDPKGNRVMLFHKEDMESGKARLVTLENPPVRKPTVTRYTF